MTNEKQNQAIEAGLHELVESIRSAVLATTNAAGQSEVSYASFVVDENGNFYIFISEAASHTKNLMNNPALSLMLIEDESATKEIYARRRLTLKCEATFIPRDDADFEVRIAQLTERHGSIVNTLLKMSDFHLVRLTPVSGRLILGFAKAYDLKGSDFSSFQQATVGHR